jgi:hypothetical protein
MLNRQGADLPVPIQVENGVFVQVSGLRYFGPAEPNREGIGVLEVSIFMARRIDH